MIFVLPSVERGITIRFVLCPADVCCTLLKDTKQTFLLLYAALADGKLCEICAVFQVGAI